jgi:hypothetical protein
MMTRTSVMHLRYPSYHQPLEIARSWLRDGQHRADALELLTLMRQKYAHVVAIGNELVLALLENDQPEKALGELEKLKQQFPEVNEEMRCRWGRIYKEQGDRAGREGEPGLAETWYRNALEEYDRGYDLRQGHYAGINKATMLLLLAALARQRHADARSVEYLREMEAMAEEVLARAPWPVRLPDDNIWHPATAGEAYLLKRDWSEAAQRYRAALGQANVQPFHQQSMGKQAKRILEAWALLDVQPEPPLDNVEAMFGLHSGNSN